MQVVCAYMSFSGCFPMNVYICVLLCKCVLAAVREREREREIENENSFLQFPREALYTNFQPWAITHSTYTST